MELKYPLIHIDETRREQAFDAAAPEAELKLPISKAQGSTTTAYNLTIPPSAMTGGYALSQCDEMFLVLSGGGTLDLAGDNLEIKAGHCVHIPAGCPRNFQNTSLETPAVMTGFLIDAPDWNAAGFTKLDDAGPFANAAANGMDPVVVHLDDVDPASMSKSDGWRITDFRLPLGRHNAIGSTLFRARFFPGAVHAKHRHENCDEIYHVISGHGLAGAGSDRAEVRGGDFHFIPRGVEHWLYNLSGREPIEVVGIYIGAGNVEETGYVFMGEVSPEDVE